MKNFISRRPGLTKLVLISLISILICVENFLAICDITAWLKTDSYPVDINRFQSHTGNTINCL